MKKVKTMKVSNIYIICIVFIFLCIIFRLLYISLGNIHVGEKSLHEFASNRQIAKKTIYARRGTIYSSKGEVLAKDVNSYTVIAYLDSSRTKDPNRPYHVVNKEETAKKLSSYINMSKESILKLLNTKYKSCDGTVCTEKVPYQVELGPGGRGITELVKDEIEDLELPGIDFISSTKRYYPNGNFMSYTLGYARTNDDGKYCGEMGLELYYNDILTGEDGYMEYQKDLEGYQITDTPSTEKKSVPGQNIYLTIDTNIQMFAEQAVATLDKASPEWSTVSVMNAKTGEILAVAASPNFNNNTLEIKSYYDPFLSYNYEPGSTMKIFSFMAAMENGIYDGKSKYTSGRLKVDDAVIKDWNGYGWGRITYDDGFMGSSNVAASNLALTLGRAKLKDFYSNLGFGSETGITLPNEAKGSINFKYNTEVASASYGQGMSVTAVQMLQALSSLGNGGVTVKPYIVSKIVDNDGNIIVENKREELNRVCSEETANKLITLMRGVVNGDSRISTGTAYKVKGVDLIGKTGTAEIAGDGGYLKNSYVRSFAGLFPGKDPEIIVYAASSKSKSSSYLKTAVKDLVKNVSTYLNMTTNNTSSSSDYNVDSYINSNTESVVNSIGNNADVIVIGSGDKIINQYPIGGSVITKGNKIILLTNGSEYEMVDIKGWSRSEVTALSSILKLNTVFEGNGYVKSYSIKSGTKVKNGETLEVVLEEKFQS